MIDRNQAALAAFILGAYGFWLGYQVGKRLGRNEAADSMMLALDAAIYGRKVVDSEQR